VLFSQRYRFSLEFPGVHPPFFVFHSHLFILFCFISRLSFRLPDGVRSNTVYKQPGGTGFTDDKSTSKSIRLFPVMGRGILFLPNKKLCINLREA
jgi:hypothetical protein